MRRLVQNIGAIAAALLSTAVMAGSVGPEAFNSEDSLESFDSLANLSGNLNSPHTLGNVTYSTTSGVIRLFTRTSEGNSAGQCYPDFGNCIGTGLEDIESIALNLTGPVSKVGVWVGLGYGDPWSAKVTFYSGQQRLGVIELGGPGHEFAGWESKSKSWPITRVVVEDNALNNRVIAIDSIVYSTRPRKGGPK